jgi:cell division protein FtsZ
MSDDTIKMNPKITVIGVGGAGGNVINNMIAAGLINVKFVVANTDMQALAASKAELRIQLGENLTEGLGAGSDPEIGEAAAEEAAEQIRAALVGSHMLFVAAGMGGGTGTGAAYVIAREAREFDILTVAVVTKPFQFEGSKRLRNAEAGIAELRKYADTLLVIPNENLFRVATDKTTFADAFVMADQVMYSGIVTITDLVVKEGLINLDLADVRAVLGGMGRAMMGMGEAAGEQRAIAAAEEAIVNPLLDEVTLKGAKSLLLCITGGRDMTLWEVEEAASRVCQEVDPDANIIVGATFDDGLGDRIRVSIVASGMPKSVETESARDADLPVWVPRSQRDIYREPEGVAEHFGRRLAEALNGEPEIEPQPAARPVPRARARTRRAQGEGDLRDLAAANGAEPARDAQARLPKPPAPSRARRSPAARKAADGAPRLERVPTLDAPPRLDGPPRKTPPPLSNGEPPEMRRRARRAPAEDTPANDWRERPLPNGEAIYPARELTAPIIPQRDPETVPRKLGFFERLGFGRGRRQA